MCMCVCFVSVLWLFRVCFVSVYVYGAVYGDVSVDVFSVDDSVLCMFPVYVLVICCLYGVYFLCLFRFCLLCCVLVL